MTKITPEELGKIAKLACIEINKESCDKLLSQVGSTISWLEQLNSAQIDKNNLSNNSEEYLSMHADKTADNNNIDDILSNAKQAKYNYFSVPKVIE